jgi:MATE family multidrug resistance protein
MGRVKRGAAGTGTAGDSAAGAAGVRHPLAEMVTIAGPTVVTMASYTIMQMVDVLMVSRIGPEPVYVAAQGNGGMVVWLGMSFGIGLLAVVNTHVSQNLGAGRAERGSAYAWNGLWLAAIAALIILPVIPFMPALFGIIHADEDLVRLESAYGGILASGAFFTLGARGIAQYFFGMHRPGIVMVAAITGNAVNLVANWALIFGHLGLPALGVAGAAIGTVMGSAVELGIPLAVFVSRRWDARYASRRAWKPSRGALADILRIGWPAGLMMGNEMVCWTYLMTYLLGAGGIAAGEDPVVHNTAGWIALRYMHLSFMPAVGLSIAVSAIVGRCMGMRRADLAQQRALLGLGIALCYMGLCALAFVVFRQPMIRLFIPASASAQSAAALVEVGSRVMIAAAVFQVFDATAIVLIAALRGAGDTFWPGVMTVVLSWVCIVAGGHILIFLAPGLGSMGPWLGASAYIIILGLALLARFAHGGWKSIDVIGLQRAHAEPLREGTAEPVVHAAESVAGATPGV